MAGLRNSLCTPSLRQRVIIAYHGVAQETAFNCVSKDLFRSELYWLKERYAVVPLHELIADLTAPEQRDLNLASITFDDGYVNFCELALPVLCEADCHATLFVPSGKVGLYNDWDEGQANFNKMPIMSYGSLRELPRERVEIGSHGVNHWPLDRLSVEKAVYEISVSRAELEQNIGNRVRFMAFPYGRFSPSWQTASHRVGKELMNTYEAVCTTRWGRYNGKNDLFALRRIGAWENDSYHDFQAKLLGDFDWLVGKESFGRILKNLPWFSL